MLPLLGCGAALDGPLITDYSRGSWRKRRPWVFRPLEPIGRGIARIRARRSVRSADCPWVVNLACRGYTEIVECSEWAKAHFFVGYDMLVDLERIRAAAERVAKSEGMTWVDVEMKGGAKNALLRIYVDKPEGVSHADCQNVSEQLSAILDVEDPFPGKYTLEVSSPGLDRKISKASDFEHFAGRRARLVLRDPLPDSDQRVLEGRLAGFESGRVRFEPDRRSGRLDAGEVKDVDLENITKAQLIVEI